MLHQCAASHFIESPSIEFVMAKTEELKEKVTKDELIRTLSGRSNEKNSSAVYRIMFIRSLANPHFD
jgi:hypothetical protein